MRRPTPTSEILDEPGATHSEAIIEYNFRYLQRNRDIRSVSEEKNHLQDLWNTERVMTSMWSTVLIRAKGGNERWGGDEKAMAMTMALAMQSDVQANSPLILLDVPFVACDTCPAASELGMTYQGEYMRIQPPLNAL
jgi:hypothetical protein